MPLVAHVIEGERAERVLVLVHGLGADEHDLAPLVPYLDPGGRCFAVLPRAPHAMPPGYAWFGFGAHGADPGTFLEALDLLDELLDSACRDTGTARADAIVCGFSQGAMLALALGLRKGSAARPAGIVAMSGALPAVDGLDYAWGDPSLPAVLVQHGTNDPVVPVDRGRKAARDLASRAVAVELREYPMGHELSLDSVEDARRWLDDLVTEGAARGAGLEEGR